MIIRNFLSVASNKIATLNEESKELEENLSNPETITCTETSKPMNRNSTNGKYKV